MSSLRRKENESKNMEYNKKNIKLSIKIRIK